MIEVRPELEVVLEDQGHYWKQEELDEYYEGRTAYKPDFRLAKGLKIEQIQAAKDYTKAIYDDSIRQLLEIPEYKPDEIRDIEIP